MALYQCLVKILGLLRFNLFVWAQKWINFWENVYISFWNNLKNDITNYLENVQ